MFRQAAALVAAACFLFGTPARADDLNFSQYPGFTEYFAANPPADTLPSAEDQALLTRYRPRLYIGDAAETDPPIRFYEDYIAQGRLLARDGSVIGDAVTEVAYELRFLPPSDAFYMFKGFLGEKRLLPGRSGPPGASYNTLPAFKPLHRQMIAFHWRDRDPDYADWIKEPGRGFEKLAARFARLLKSVDD